MLCPGWAHRSTATAVVGCVAAPDGGVRVALAEIWQGSDAVLKASGYIEELVAAGRPIKEVVFDPMRFSSEALRLERVHGLVLVEWAQSETTAQEPENGAAENRGGLR